MSEPFDICSPAAEPWTSSGTALLLLKRFESQKFPDTRAAASAFWSSQRCWRTPMLDVAGQPLPCPALLSIASLYIALEWNLLLVHTKRNKQLDQAFIKTSCRVTVSSKWAPINSSSGSSHSSSSPQRSQSWPNISRDSSSSRSRRGSSSSSRTTKTATSSLEFWMQSVSWAQS